MSCAQREGHALRTHAREYQQNGQINSKSKSLVQTAAAVAAAAAAQSTQRIQYFYAGLGAASIKTGISKTFVGAYGIISIQSPNSIEDRQRTMN